MKQDYKAMGSWGTLGLEIVLCILFGALAGRWVDGKFGTDLYLLMLGFFFGLGAAGKAVHRTWKDMQKVTAREEREQGNPAPRYEKPKGDEAPAREKPAREKGSETMAEPENDEDKPPRPLGDASMRAAVIAVAISGAALALIALVIFDARSALGVAIGAAIATANLAVFARLGEAFLSRRGNTAPWAVIALFKLVFLFGGIWMILKSEIVSGLSLAAGYGAMPLGITFGSLFGPKPPEDDLPPKKDRKTP